MKLLLFFLWWCGGMRLYAHDVPVCSTDAPAVSVVVLELWPSSRTTPLTAGASIEHTGIS